MPRVNSIQEFQRDCHVIVAERVTLQSEIVRRRYAHRVTKTKQTHAYAKRTT